jgi:hypothetical protein
MNPLTFSAQSSNNYENGLAFAFRQKLSLPWLDSKCGLDTEDPNILLISREGGQQLAKRVDHQSTAGCDASEVEVTAK